MGVFFFVFCFLAFRFVFILSTYFCIVVENYDNYWLRIIGWSWLWVIIPSASWPDGEKGGKKDPEKKNHFVNFAVELLFEFLYSHLHSGFSKTTGANCRWILLQSQTDTSASGYMSLIFKDDQQQQDLCPGVQEQRASMNSEGTYRLCYFHLSTQSRPPFQLHFRSFNTDFSYLHLGII